MNSKSRTFHALLTETVSNYGNWNVGLQANQLPAIHFLNKTYMQFKIGDNA